MSAEFDQDLRRAHDDIAAGREQLLDVVKALSDDDLDRGRRGGWSVRRVLEHVIESEWLYARLATHLRDLPQPEGDTPATKAPSVAEAARAMGAAREALLAAVEGVDEETFYRL
ncbi:MAG: DinB family protein, partial [Chloroflexi bacterium]|nr:DinB family protein [Chloroflexota bacterium]